MGGGGGEAGRRGDLFCLPFSLSTSIADDSSRSTAIESA